MKTINLKLLAISLAVLFYACEDNTKSQNADDWLIPISEIRDGGPGKDGIPALENPLFDAASNIEYLSDDDLVLAYRSGNAIKVYPHSILDWHEIINDEINGEHIAITYCPLTGTGIGWDRNINGSVSTFGVSGLLYNSNLIPYDRKTNSNWSQMGLNCINGELIESEITTHTLFETSWKTLKAMYPDAQVVSENTGFSRAYGRYPYGSYKTDDSYLIFPVSNADPRLPNKDRVLGVIVGEEVKAYQFEHFKEKVNLLEDQINGNDILIVGSETDNFITAFYKEGGDDALEFTAVQNSYPAIMSDNEGNTWDVFGFALNGPRKGQQLKPTKSFIGYWFSWAAFYPDVTLYE